MLMLLFRIGEQPWAIASTQVCEVVPLVALQAMSQGWLDGDSQGETALAGLINYHGDTIPVVDVSVLIGGRVSAQTLNTRIVVVEASDSLARSSEGSAAEQKSRRVGLILTQVSETARLEPVANVPVTNRYVQSTWTLAGQSAEHASVVYRLAVDPIVSWVYQETAAETNRFSRADTE